MERAYGREQEKEKARGARHVAIIYGDSLRSDQLDGWWLLLAVGALSFMGPRPEHLFIQKYLLSAFSLLCIVLGWRIRPTFCLGNLTSSDGQSDHKHINK